jgi:16S rRNA (adenine1518-N6/adenine1519-N6)-dimethyltransferase
MIDDLPPLRDVIAKYELNAKKALGQNFLLDFNIIQKIALTTGPLDGQTVIEIGPGPGGLTRALLAGGAKRVIAIERDERCLPALAEIGDYYPGQLQVVHGDALAVDCASFADGSTRIIANLPYNVATPLLTGWLTVGDWPPFYSAMSLMFQKEVAERITARPGDKAYGRLAVLTGWRCTADIAFNLDPQNFTPAPKVMSSVVTFTPKPSPLPAKVKSLEAVTKAAFGQRRKMLRQSLKTLGGAELLERVGIAGTRRAEELDIEEFVLLANGLVAS